MVLSWNFSAEVFDMLDTSENANATRSRSLFIIRGMKKREMRTHEAREGWGGSRVSPLWGWGVA